MLKLTEIKAEIVKARIVAQYLWDNEMEKVEDYINKEWMHINIDVSGLDPEDYNHVCIYSDSDANYEASTVYDKWVCIWSKGKNVIESSRTRIERQKREATESPIVDCDLCGKDIHEDCDVETCKHCGDIFCPECFWELEKGDHCSEAPDAQPRGNNE